MKRIAIYLACILVLIGAVLPLYACEEKSDGETEEFYYAIHGEELNVTDIKLSVLRKKEVIVIPEYVDGYCITQVGADTFAYPTNTISCPIGIEAVNVRRLYLPRTAVRFSIIRNYVPYGKVVHLGKIELKDTDTRGLYYNPYYTSHVTDATQTDVYVKHTVNSVVEKQKCADVVYFYNYDGAPTDGYYWVDDYDNERICYRPEDSVREGYTFGGWYKEQECVNAWDFDKDVVPAKRTYYDEEAQKDYYYLHITRLFAKWIPAGN